MRIENIEEFIRLNKGSMHFKEIYKQYNPKTTFKNIKGQTLTGLLDSNGNGYATFVIGKSLGSEYIYEGEVEGGLPHGQG